MVQLVTTVVIIKRSAFAHAWQQRRLYFLAEELKWREVAFSV